MAPAVPVTEWTSSIRSPIELNQVSACCLINHVTTHIADTVYVFNEDSHSHSTLCVFACACLNRSLVQVAVKQHSAGNHGTVSDMPSLMGILH